MYNVHISRRAMKDIADLPSNYARLVSLHIDLLAKDPRPSGSKKLRGRTDYRLRVGVYRILYEIDDNERKITIYRVKHRSEVYRQ